MNKAQFIRTFSCFLCGASPVDASHVRTADNSGTGRKPDDRYLVPACRQCHAREHNGGRSYAVMMAGVAHLTREEAKAYYLDFAERYELMYQERQA